MRYVFLSMLFSINSVFASDAFKRADLEKTYPPENYFIGIGSGNHHNENRALQIATDEARGDLAKTIISSIKSETSSSKSARQDMVGNVKVKETVEKSYKSEIKVSSSVENLAGIEPGKSIFDDETNMASVYVIYDRVKNADDAKVKITDAGNTVRSYFENGLKEVKTLYRIRGLRKALRELGRISKVLALYEAVAPASYPKVDQLLGIQRSEVENRFMTEVSSTVLKISFLDEKEANGIFLSGLNKSGFRVDDKSAVQLKISFAFEEHKDKMLDKAGIMKHNCTVTTDIFEGEEKVGSFRMNFSEAGNDPDSAKRALLAEMTRESDKKYIDQLIDNF